MFSYSKLLGAIKEKFENNGNFAAAMNISEHTLSKKLNNKSSFDQHEIRKACELLNIAPNKIKDYFFEIKVQNDWTDKGEQNEN